MDKEGGYNKWIIALYTQILSGILTIVKGPAGQDEGCPEDEHEDKIL